MPVHTPPGQTGPRPALRAAVRAAFIVLALPGVLSASACTPRIEPPDSAFLMEWMNAWYAAARVERMSPPYAARFFAYAAVALYEGVASGDPRLRSLAGQLPGLDSLPRPDPGARLDPVLVAVAAQREVLDWQLAEASIATRLRLVDLTERQLLARGGGPDGGRRHAESEAYGRALGAALVAWGHGDRFGSTRNLAWTPGLSDSVWVNTTSPSEYTTQSVSAAVDYVALDNPSALVNMEQTGERSLLLDRPRSAAVRDLVAINPAGALEPFWGALRPFALVSGDECDAPDPPPYSSDPHSPFGAQVLATYHAVQNGTEEQRHTAFFWADTPGQTGTTPGHWISILAQVTEQQQLSASAAAEALVLLSAGLADSFIACWNTKYRTNVMRPSTWIQRHIDPDWTSIVVTPPFPEYTSGHSVASGAASTVLTALAGAVGFEDATHVGLGHAPRRFESFEAAAREAASSRLYGGIHYPMAIETGLDQGRCVGTRVLQRLRTRL